MDNFSRCIGECHSMWRKMKLDFLFTVRVGGIRGRVNLCAMIGEVLLIPTFLKV